MICCSIQHKTKEEIEAILEKVEMAEVRLDRCDLDDGQISEIFSNGTPTVATCRLNEVAFADAERRLLLAIKAGARYVDVEVDAPRGFSKRISEACREWGTTLIRSYHDFEKTPSLDELRSIVDRCRHYGGQVVKIVTVAKTQRDVSTVMGLYKFYTPESLIAFTMMEGADSGRSACLEKGAPFSYCCPDGDEPVAQGQICYSRMYKAIYADFPRLSVREPVRMPASKSYAQRAIIAAALAEGVSTLRGYTPCADNESAICLAEQLGAEVSGKKESDGSAVLEIKGHPATPARQAPSSLNVGESGLLARLILPLSCNLFCGDVVVEGKGTLRQRSLDGVDVAIKAMGGRCVSEISGLSRHVADSGRCAGQRRFGFGKGSPCDDSVFLPMKVGGPLKGGSAVIDGSKTSQIVSGALMALPLCPRNSRLVVQNPVSLPYVFITMDILRKFGIKTRSEMLSDSSGRGSSMPGRFGNECDELVLKIGENQRYKPAGLTLEGDWSSAAAFLAAGAIFGEVSLAGLDTSSLQADLSIMDILLDAGASLSQIDEPDGIITARKAPLSAIRVDLTNAPDLFPVVAILCAFCQGRSRLGGLHRLKHKESDRAAAILEMLSAAGVKVFAVKNEMVIDGECLTSRLMNSRLLRGGSYSSHNDHRMVFALRLAELGADSQVIIDNEDCVSKSYPQFNDIWNEYIRKKF